MAILALDLAKKTGYALSRVDGPPMFDTLSLSDGTVGDNQGRAYARLYDWLVPFIRMGDVRKVMFEAPNRVANHSEDTALFLTGLCAIVEVACWKAAKIKPECANVTTVRKAVVGHGFCGKPGVEEYCRRRGWNVSDDNQADALALLVFAGGA